MKNKLPFLVLLVVLLFPCSAFADDVSISENDLVDVSANEFFVEEFDSNQLLLTAPLASENEVIDYSDYLNAITSYFAYTEHDNEFHDGIFEDDSLYFTFGDSIHIYDYDDGMFYEFDVNDYFGTVTDYYFGNYPGAYFVNVYSTDFINSFRARIELELFDTVNGINYYRSKTIDYYTIETTREYVYAPSAQVQYYSYNEILCIKYLVVFLVLERVLYIGWDLINFGGKKHE